MRSLILILAIGVVTVASGFAENPDPERDFQRDRTKYTREHFSMGEDASSGYDYLFYKHGPKIVMVRVIWSASYTNELRIDDFYLAGDLTLHRKQTGRKSQLGPLKRGQTVPLVVKDERRFSNGRMTMWVSGAKLIGPSDPRWATTEKESLEQSKSEVESYSFLKENN